MEPEGDWIPPGVQLNSLLDMTGISNSHSNRYRSIQSCLVFYSPPTPKRPPPPLLAHSGIIALLSRSLITSCPCILTSRRITVCLSHHNYCWHFFFSLSPWCMRLAIHCKMNFRTSDLQPSAYRGKPNMGEGLNCCWFWSSEFDSFSPEATFTEYSLADWIFSLICSYKELSRSLFPSWL